MGIEHLSGLRKENPLSDILASIFRRSPNLIPLFVKKFAKLSVTDDPFVLFTRKRLSAIPEIDAGLFEKLQPDIILQNSTYLILLENKRDAVLGKNQLDNYIQAVQGTKGQRTIIYFLIAPRTSRYQGLPNEFIQVDWDEIYDFVLTNDHGISEQDLHALGRFRLFFFKKICDGVLDNLRSEFSNLPYVSDKPTSDYYGVHFTLPQSSDVVFSLALFLQSPSYLKLFPFKVRYQSKLITFNQGTHPIIEKYRTILFKLPRTEHDLKSSLPGYVFDLFPRSANDVKAIAQDIRVHFKNECQQMIATYNSLS
jgi:hypothetical protein